MQQVGVAWINWGDWGQDPDPVPICGIVGKIDGNAVDDQVSNLGMGNSQGLDQIFDGCPAMKFIYQGPAGP
jgi:hypothetical protein